MNTNENNSTHTAEEILSSVKTAVQEFNNGGEKIAFFHAILQAVKWTGVENFVKMTKLNRVEIYDTLDGVSPSFDNLSRILAVFGVRITFDFAEKNSSITNLHN